MTESCSRLKELFIQAIEHKLTPEKRKTRRPPPAIGSPDAPRIGVLTPEQMDEAMFGDVNVWLALLVRQHEHHKLARKWFDTLTPAEGGLCRLVQLA